MRVSTLLVFEGTEPHRASIEEWFHKQQVPFLSVNAQEFGEREQEIDQWRRTAEQPVVLDFRWNLALQYGALSDPVLNQFATTPESVWILSSSPLLLTAELAAALQSPFVARFNGLPTFFPDAAVVEVMLPDADAAKVSFLEEYFKLLGKEIEVVGDTVCFTGPRVLAMIINEAYFCLQERVASAEDIDTAMKLGTNYPRGPVEWGEQIGLDCVCAMLDALYAYYHQERYRCALLLRRQAVQKNRRMS